MFVTRCLRKLWHFRWVIGGFRKGKTDLKTIKRDVMCRRRHRHPFLHLEGHLYASIIVASGVPDHQGVLDSY